MQQIQIPIKEMARNTDPATSHMAAADASDRIAGKHENVLRLLASGPLTDFELAHISGLQQTSIGKRRGECRDKYWVEAYHKDGKPVRRRTPSGSKAQVWKISDLGLKALRGES